mgnify:CR=1 FL=1
MIGFLRPLWAVTWTAIGRHGAAVAITGEGCASTQQLCDPVAQETFSELNRYGMVPGCLRGVRVCGVLASPPCERSMNDGAKCIDV